MKVILLVLSHPGSPEVADEYNDWYTNTHVPEGLAVPGYTCVTRYKAFAGWDPFPQKYLSLHELEVTSTDVVKLTGRRPRERAKGGRRVVPAVGFRFRAA